MFEYENQALLPLIRQLEVEVGGGERLRELASDAPAAQGNKPLAEDSRPST
jgi:hypothetical protein